MTTLPSSSVKSPWGVLITEPSAVPTPTTLICISCFLASLTAPITAFSSSRSSTSVKSTMALPTSLPGVNEATATASASAIFVPCAVIWLGSIVPKNDFAEAKSDDTGIRLYACSANVTKPILSLDMPSIMRSSNNLAAVIRVGPSMSSVDDASIELLASTTATTSIPSLFAVCSVRPPHGRAKASTRAARAIRRNVTLIAGLYGDTSGISGLNTSMRPKRARRDLALRREYQYKAASKGTSNKSNKYIGYAKLSII